MRSVGILYLVGGVLKKSEGKAALCALPLALNVGKNDC